MAATLYISNGVQAELVKQGWCDGLTLQIRPRDTAFGGVGWIENSSGWTCEQETWFDSEEGAIDRTQVRRTVFVKGSGRERREYKMFECRMERGGEEWVVPLEGWRARDVGFVRVWDFPLSIFVTYTPQ